MNAGIVTEKLNITKKMKADSSALLSSTSTEVDYFKKEEIYSKLRPELTTVFRYAYSLAIFVG